MLHFTLVLQLLLALLTELAVGFNMIHRGDRDSHLQYTCANVIGYEDALKKAEADGHDAKELCECASVAEKYGFEGQSYVKAGSVNSIDFDFGSIMHYNSYENSNPKIVEKDPEDPENYPIVKKGEDGKKEILQKPGGSWGISDSDKQAIQYMYPWPGDNEGMAGTLALEKVVFANGTVPGPARVKAGGASTLVTVARAKAT